MPMSEAIRPAQFERPALSGAEGVHIP